MDGKGDFLAGVLVGAVVGALAGILLAPASGAETRALVADKGRELKDLAAEKVREKSEAAISAGKDLIAMLRERLPMTEQVQDVLDQADQELAGC